VWVGKKSTLENTPYPGGSPGFTEEQFRATKEQLVKEVTALSDVCKYFDTLKEPFDKVQRSSQVDLAGITHTVKKELNPGDAWSTPAWRMQLMSYSLKVGALAGPPAS
jgi:hypothetical protein